MRRVLFDRDSVVFRLGLGVLDCGNIGNSMVDYG